MIHSLVGKMFPRLSDYLTVGDLSQFPKSEFSPRRFTWERQQDLEWRLKRAKRFLNRVFAREVPVVLRRYEGPPTQMPLVLTVNPLEAISFAGNGQVDYGAVAAMFINASTEIGVMPYCIKNFLREGKVVLDETAAASWEPLLQASCEAGDTKALTIWELPFCPATYFAEKGDSETAWNLNARDSSRLAFSAGRLLSDVISFLVIGETEPHLGSQVARGSSPGIILLGTREPNFLGFASESFEAVATFWDGNKRLSLSHKANETYGSIFTSATFLPPDLTESLDSRDRRAASGK